MGLCAALLEAAFLLLRRFHPFSQHVPEFLALALAAGVVYFIAVWLVFSPGEADRGALAVVLLAAALFRATLFPLPPTLSNDLYRYLWDGRIQLAGYNPYLVTPADPDLALFRPPGQIEIPGPGYPTFYPPLTELLFRLLAPSGVERAAQLDGLFNFKLASLVFDLGSLLVLVALLRVRGEPPVRALVYGWCPLVVLEFAGSGHNDSLALFFLLLANYSIIRQRAAESILALAAATMSKWFAAVAVPVFLRRSRWRDVVWFLAAGLLLSLPYREAGWRLLGNLLLYAERWRNNSSLFALLRSATGSEWVPVGAALAVVAGLSIYYAVRRVEPLRACYVLFAAVLLLAANVFPWYVTWLVPFLCFFPTPAFLLWTATVLLSYHVLIDYTVLGLWRETPWLLWLEYLPVYALLLVRLLKVRIGGTSGKLSS